MILHRALLCVHPLSRLPVLDDVLVVALLVLLLLSRLGVASLLALPFVPLLLLFGFMLLEFLVEGLVLPGELLKVGREVLHLLLHCSHFWRLTTGREQLCINFH
jgi:hypothetical protein